MMMMMMMMMMMVVCIKMKFDPGPALDFKTDHQMILMDELRGRCCWLEVEKGVFFFQADFFFASENKVTSPVAALDFFGPTHFSLSGRVHV